jgi:hypothetical protein
MELVIAVLALVVALVALGLVLGLRNQLAALARAAAAAPPPPPPPAPPPLPAYDDTAVRAEVDAVRRELQRVVQELGELKAAAEVVPVPPLPKARRGGLDDLREQLRASHRESADEESAEPPPTT